MATLDDIVSAAAKVFRTKGYHAATVRDIADEVGLLKGSLYHHFDSKEELLYLVVKEPIAQMYRTMAEHRRGRRASRRQAAPRDLRPPGGLRPPLSASVCLSSRARGGKAPLPRNDRLFPERLRAVLATDPA